MSEPDRLTRVVEVSGDVVAVMSARRSTDPAVLELTALYVHPDHSGKGLGSRLHRVFEDEKRPGEDAVLEVWAGNARAIDFYAHRGWVVTSTTRDGPQGLPFVTYRLVGDQP